LPPAGDLDAQLAIAASSCCDGTEGVVEPSFQMSAAVAALIAGWNSGAVIARRARRRQRRPRFPRPAHCLMAVAVWR
jgi:hypothetical protein